VRGPGAERSSDGGARVILLPAIDILDGKAVRLTRGEFDAQTVYDADPLQAARRWAEDGARGLHVVDLDGARSGAPVNLEQLERIAHEVEVPIQFGGGLRTIEAVGAAIEAGAARVMLGTAAYSDIDLLDDAVARFGNRVAVSVDARDGMLATSGWTEQTEMPVESVIERMSGRGVRRFVYSSIDRDGTLAGPDLEGARRVAQVVRGSFIYSGGVSALEDIAALWALRQVNLAGVIVGKALYEGRFTVDEAQQVLDR
jgi:phosphoribosylformimino-5-aminoimidazole carboxamide ribotide isomerase